MKVDHHHQQQHPHFNHDDTVSSSPFDTNTRESETNGRSSSSSFSFSDDAFSPTSANSERSHDPSLVRKKKNFGRKAKNYAVRIREHVKMGANFSETVKGKLSVGAKIVKQGGRENIFRHIFGANEEEKLLKASQCYLSTTAGPMAGILFISTQRVAFCSERPINFPVSAAGAFVRSLYKVCIPVNKIKRANQSENIKKPTQKYIEIVTEDNFEFWFMGFVRYEKALVNLQKAISMYN